jgi:hypothetical protein
MSSRFTRAKVGAKELPPTAALSPRGDAGVRSRRGCAIEWMPIRA